MKKRLRLKRVTLRNLDDVALDQVAGGVTHAATCAGNATCDDTCSACFHSCINPTCPTIETCVGQGTCVCPGGATTGGGGS